MAPILSVQNLSTGYGKKQVLFDVSLDVMPGEIVLITGGNGSGKSTLFKAIYGLIPPWNPDAKIVFRPDPEGANLTTSSSTFNLSKGLAYLPQMNSVFADLTVEDNFRLAGYAFGDRREFAERRDKIMAAIPVLNPLLCRKLERMSGGERQIVGLAMVLLHRPKLLLLDEPTAGLSPDNRGLIIDLLQQIMRSSLTRTLLIVEHRISGRPDWVTRVAKMQFGRLTIPSQPT
jgi:branched-chain amino acid transport system ATP-binding protein